MDQEKFEVMLDIYKLQKLGVHIPIMMPDYKTLEELKVLRNALTKEYEENVSYQKFKEGLISSLKLLYQTIKPNLPDLYLDRIRDDPDLSFLV